MNRISQIAGRAPTRGPFIEHQTKIGLWVVKLPSVDASIVRRTLAFLAQNSTGIQCINETLEHQQNRIDFWSSINPAHFEMKIASPNLFNIFGFITVGLLIRNLSKFHLEGGSCRDFMSFLVSAGSRKAVPRRRKSLVTPLKCGLSIWKLSLG